jgi:hypothetical protein
MTTPPLYAHVNTGSCADMTPCAHTVGAGLLGALIVQRIGGTVHYTNQLLPEPPTCAVTVATLVTGHTSFSRYGLPTSWSLGAPANQQVTRLSNPIGLLGLNRIAASSALPISRLSVDDDVLVDGSESARTRVHVVGGKTLGPVRLP